MLVWIARCGAAAIIGLVIGLAVGISAHELVHLLGG